MPWSIIEGRGQPNSGYSQRKLVPDAANSWFCLIVINESIFIQCVREGQESLPGFQNKLTLANTTQAKAEAELHTLIN